MHIEENKNATVYPTACGGKLNDVRYRPSVDYRGRRVWFCRRACLRTYETDPDRFMAGHIPHPLEED